MQRGEGTSRRAPPWVGEGPPGPRAAAQVSVTGHDEGGSGPPPRLLRRAPAQIHRDSSMARAGKGRREQGFRAREGTIHRQWAVPATSAAGAVAGHAGELCSRGHSIRERRGSHGRAPASSAAGTRPATPASKAPVPLDPWARGCGQRSEESMRETEREVAVGVKKTLTSEPRSWLLVWSTRYRG
jgi:hypothetical protein